MNNDNVKKWLASLGGSSAPSLDSPAIASSSQTPTETRHADKASIVDLTLGAGEGDKDAELPVTKVSQPAHAPAKKQGSGALPPIDEERAIASKRTKGSQKRASTPPAVLPDHKKQRRNEPGVTYYDDEPETRFVATGPGDEDMRKFLAADVGCDVAWRFINNMPPEALAKETQRSLALVSGLPPFCRHYFGLPRLAAYTCIFSFPSHSSMRGICPNAVPAR